MIDHYINLQLATEKWEMNPIIQEEFVSYTNPITYIVIPSQQG
jgi:hypothetical protein